MKKEKIIFEIPQNQQKVIMLVNADNLRDDSTILKHKLVNENFSETTVNFNGLEKLATMLESRPDILVLLNCDKYNWTVDDFAKILERHNVNYKIYTSANYYIDYVQCGQERRYGDSFYRYDVLFKNPVTEQEVMDLLEQKLHFNYVPYSEYRHGHGGLTGDMSYQILSPTEAILWGCQDYTD